MYTRDWRLVVQIDLGLSPHRNSKNFLRTFSAGALNLPHVA